MKQKRWLAALAMAAMLTSGVTGEVLAKEKHDINVAIKASAMPVEGMEEGQTDSAANLTKRINEIIGPMGSKEVQGVQSGHLYIPKDTVITLQLVERVSSKRNKKGSSFSLKVTDHLIINDTVVIPKDEVVRGVVVASHGNGLFGRGGRLEINIPEVKTLNDVSVPLNGYVKGYGSDDNGAVVVAAVVTVVGGLFMRGENIYYEPGQLFEVKVKEDTDLLVTPETLKEAMRADRVRGNVVRVEVAK